MATLDDLLRRTDLTDADADWLHLLVGEWQLLADLSFADLLLWVRTTDTPPCFVVAAQIRPTTGPTVFHDDEVGTEAIGERQAMLSRAFAAGDAPWVPAESAEDAVPVRRDGRLVAVVSRHGRLTPPRARSALEAAYLRTADELAQMVSEGRFPAPGADLDVDASQRVGDGLIRLDVDGVVTYASPNAQSAYRRLGWTGDLTGERLTSVTRELIPDERAVSESTAAMVEGRAPRSREIEANGAVVHLRAIPLRPHGERVGAVVLVRDVTELRVRDRQLLSKDATIREIHHRVKNNLQTVAALLRLQARRLDAPEARAALEESVRRVASIALVHETLSTAHEEAVHFDEIAARIGAMVADVTDTRGRVRTSYDGTFGVLPAEVATPLAVVVTELVQNAAEHAFADAGGGADRADHEVAGTIALSARRDGALLRVVVADDGTGLPPEFSLEASPRLGLQIVRTLVVSEMGGTIEVRRRAPRGTEVVLEVPVPDGGGALPPQPAAADPGAGGGPGDLRT